MAVADPVASTEPVVLDIVEQRDRLLDQLTDQRHRVHRLWDWYRGRQQLPDVQAKYAQAYQLFLRDAITPWARLVVDAIAERLRVQGFRSAEDEAAEGAWRAFKRARLNADQRLVYVEALIGGTGYVSAGTGGQGEARIVPESALEVTHEPDLADRQTVAAALKMYPVDYSRRRRRWVCELYRPDATYRWLAELDRPLADDGIVRDGPDCAFPIDDQLYAARNLGWEPLGFTANEVGVVPIIPFENRAGVLGTGVSEIEDCVPILRRIDRLTLQKMLAGEYSSFKVKWATGLEVPKDPNTGRPVEPYKAAVDRLWVSENPNSRFGTFDATDITQYLSGIDSEIAALAAISRVPAHYLMQRNLANPPSAESLLAGETGLVAKVQDHQSSYGESWERAEWLRARLAGAPIDIDALEVMWANAEKRNPAQVADAAGKWQGMGVPQPALWEWGGWSPEQVQQFEQEAAAQALLAAAAAQAPAAETPAVAGGAG